MAGDVCWLAGVDEVGRGCLAGPVVAACVLLPSRDPFPPLADSKLLSPATRERLFVEITARAPAWGVAAISSTEIDRINIHQASLQAMAQAVQKITPTPDYLLVDGRFELAIAVPQRAVVAGDRHCQVVAAASIVAKVWRDRWMIEMDSRYPQYGFERHKGYPTAQHREALARLGPTPLHRRSFRGVLD